MKVRNDRMRTTLQQANLTSSPLFSNLLLAATLSALLIASGCSSSGASSSTTTTNQYATAYKSASWGSTVTVTFPSNCAMTLTTSGLPDYTPNPYYLAPASGSDTVVAHTAVTNTALSLISYADDIKPGLRGTTTTLNICPTKASSTTSAGLGAIGYLISGTAMFNPFEADASTPAVADNASYTFTDSSGNSQTAYFLDQCDTHSNGSTWHAHGNPDCVTSQVDTATGPSHIIGIALDGYPIYGGRDINGNVIAVSQLDACNGITSPTPEFPSGAYHYVLPIGVTTKYASINCFTGTVSTQSMAQARRLACNMKMMTAMLHEHSQPQPNKPEQQMMGDMTMPSSAPMPAGSM
jgi:hypothetical protein